MTLQELSAALEKMVEIGHEYPEILRSITGEDPLLMAILEDYAQKCHANVGEACQVVCQMMMTKEPEGGHGHGGG